MTTVTQTQTLKQAAELARSRYAGEAARIDRGLVLALNSAVALQADGTALVQSGSQAEIVYQVGHGACDCPDFSRAPEGRCKHRWAVCLVKKALKLQAEATAAQMAKTFYATYYSPAGEMVQGLAMETAQGWLFCGDQGEEPLYAAPQALVLGGNVAILEAQRKADGNLVAKVCGYAA